MSALPTTKQLEQMISQAMEDNSPDLYQSLIAGGTLQAVISERTAMYEEIVSRAHNRSLTKWTAESNPATPEDRIKGLGADLRVANVSALAIVLEFFPR